jgi:hypothetical protein
MAQTPLLASPSFYFSFLLYHAATSGEFLSLSLSLSLSLGVAELQQGNGGWSVSKREKGDWRG